MSFSERLNEYIAQIGCTSKQLAISAGLSEGTISRYRAGERAPLYDSKQIHSLIEGLYCLAKEKNIELDRRSILEDLNTTIYNGITVDYKTYITNLNKLLSTLDIRSGELARGLHFDPSYISRILSGTRRPADISKFNGNVSSYIVRCYSDSRYLSAIAALLGCEQADIASTSQLYDKVVKWLGSNIEQEKENPIHHFLQKMDDFNLDEYIQAIHFNDIKLPTIPFQLPTAKIYSGIEDMMTGEMDFIKATILSKSMDDVILYSDMPLEKMASDKEFPKKWMFGMAAMLKKGLHLNIIHDVNRPFEEMMLGLEGNIPMYMTGQISPYYLRRSQSDTFLHLLKVSGTAALSGEAIAGRHEEGRYTLTKQKDEVKYYRKRAERLLEKSLPLMDIYTEARKKEFDEELKSIWKSGNRRIIFSSLPVFTMSENLMEKILKRTGIGEKDINYIKAHREKYRLYVDKLLSGNSLIFEVPLFTQDRFESSKLYMDLGNIFYPKDIEYTFDEYMEHLEETREFVSHYDNCVLKENPLPAFKNITFYMVENKYVVVSKSKSPTIHFIIHHPKMVQAFQNFTPVIKD